jgi:murein hydrolase activator
MSPYHSLFNFSDEISEAFFFMSVFAMGFSLQSVDAQTKKTRAQLEKEKTDIQKRLVEFDQILKKTAETKKPL